MFIYKSLKDQLILSSLCTQDSCSKENWISYIGYSSCSWMNTSGVEMLPAVQLRRLHLLSQRRPFIYLNSIEEFIVKPALKTCATATSLAGVGKNIILLQLQVF